MNYYKKDIGKFGEDIAILYLQEIGYRILCRNFYCKQGEIDIIAFKDEIVFFEVKTRTNFKYGSPSDSVNNLKLKHMYKVAKYYLYKNNMENEFIRFDVIEVFISTKKISINHIKQVL